MMKDTSLYLIIGLLTSLSGGVLPNVTVAPKGVTTSAHDKSAFFVCIKITNRNYSDSLNNQESQESIVLRREVENVFEDTYGHEPAIQFTRISEITFSNGSVIANCTALFDTNQINGDVVRDYFVSNYKLFPSRMLELNINYTEGLEPVRTTFPVDLPSDSTSHTPTTSDSPSAHSSTHFSRNSTTHSTNHSSTESSTHSIPHTSTHSSDHTSTHSSTNPLLHSSTLPSTNSSSTHSSTNSPAQPSIHSSTEPSTHSPTNSSAISAENSSTVPSHTVSEHITSSTPAKNETHASNGTIVHPSDNSTLPHNGTVNGNDGEHTSSTATTHSPANPTKTDKPSGAEVSTTARTTTAGSASEKGVPGWGVALLVLAAIILFLLLLLFILLLLCWCCWWRRRGFMNVTDPDPPGYYNPDIPLYSTHSTFDSYNGKSSDSESEKPQKNRTGMYVVNK